MSNWLSLSVCSDLMDHLIEASTSKESDKTNGKNPLDSVPRALRMILLTQTEKLVHTAFV